MPSSIRAIFTVSGCLAVIFAVWMAHEAGYSEGVQDQAKDTARAIKACMKG